MSNWQPVNSNPNDNPAQEQQPQAPQGSQAPTQGNTQGTEQQAPQGSQAPSWREYEVPPQGLQALIDQEHLNTTVEELYNNNTDRMRSPFTYPVGTRIRF